jgi:hypothetical protein
MWCCLILRDLDTASRVACSRRGVVHLNARDDLNACAEPMPVQVATEQTTTQVSDVW